ncbi:leucine-rich repeat domain-containing protein [Maribacter sp. 2307ULW6-5]|uniref:leucine-rich repeat domain-containing protein n=1 Tax=Maribacter sp. 2307ULW6-5 TaxID=3386275 RepID=UPI0039BC6B91
MTLENQILSAVIQDHKARTVLGLTDFGDILFKEANGHGRELYSICQILPTRRLAPTPKGAFRFQIQVLALEETSFKKIQRPSRGGIFGRGASEKERELHRVLVKRYGLHAQLQQRLGKLAEGELYGHCDDDDHNSSNPHAEKVNKAAYLSQVLAYATQHPEPFYTEMYHLKRHETTPPFVLKEYYGYGFGLPEALFGYVHLKGLAIYHQSIKDLEPQKLLGFKNLNSLCLDNVDGVPQDLLEVIHQMPYLVELSLTNTDTFRGRHKMTQIPTQLHRLESLRYFSFAGNELSDWSQIVKLKNLRTLDVSHCGLTAISEQISQLQSLEELNLAHNGLEHLPDAMARLKNLKILRLAGNPLAKIPEWMAELRQLEVLELTQCGLRTLPEAMARLPKLQELGLKKNPFNTLPKSLLELPRKVVQIEMRNQALYDPKAKAKMDTYPKGNIRFKNDLNFKLMVINQLMYVDEVLLPKFNIGEFAKNHKGRNIVIDEEGYDPIPEAVAYFKELEVPMELLIDIKELKPDGGDEIYRQIVPFWDGEDDRFDVKSIEDVKHLPNLKATNTMNFSKEQVKQLRALKIKVAHY